MPERPFFQLREHAQFLSAAAEQQLKVISWKNTGWSSAAVAPTAREVASAEKGFLRMRKPLKLTYE